MSRELMNAIGRRDLQEVKRLVSEGADIHYGDDDPMYFAVIYNDLNMLEYLISEGADIHVADEVAFRVAVERGNLKIVKCLVEQGADIDILEGYALRNSAHRNHFEIVKYLMEQGANPYVYDGWIFKHCNDKMINYIKSLENNNSNNQKSDNEWNAICQKCGAQAYQGFVDFECSKGCE
jgi:ankyrin repeat protein